MKKIYTAPELEIVTFTLTDVLTKSVLESGIGENIGGGEGGDTPIDLDGLGG